MEKNQEPCSLMMSPRNWLNAGSDKTTSEAQ
ncbi:MAG: hypothetical protein AW07_03479 [Candidatus Accumulibacter sp. SK-11]|nr:MAG: hypothetical protein AW07_03479 [Candidatus Accumulibacter sp. SK-11]